MKTFRIFLLSVLLALTTSTALASVVKLYGGDKFSRGISIQQTKDRGFVITGYTRLIGNGEEDVLLLKADAAGFRVKFLPFRLCPFIFTASAILILLGGVAR